MTFDELIEFVNTKMNEAEECLREIDNTLMHEIVHSTNFNTVDDVLHIKETVKPIFNALYTWKAPI